MHRLTFSHAMWSFDKTKRYPHDSRYFLATSDTGLVAWVCDTSVVPAARVTDPSTSHEAARRASSRAAADAELVLLAHADAGERGLTGSELEAATRRSYSVIGPRRPGLERLGLIAKVNGMRRENDRGNPEQVYRITGSGRDEAARIRAAA